MAFSLRLIVLAVRGLGGVPDLELRIALAAVTATLIAFTLMGFSGPTMASATFGAFFWFTAGTAAYWFIARGDANVPPARAAGAI